VNGKDTRSADIPDLSTRCADILRFLYEYTADNYGRSPSSREIASAVGLSSTNSVHVYLKRLVEAGYIELVDGGARNIRIVGARYSNPPLPGTAVPDDDNTLDWVGEAYLRQREYLRWQTLGDAMSNALCKEMAQRIEAEILGAGGEL
jgi:SOS-response transcriptional repressor LexA